MRNVSIAVMAIIVGLFAQACATSRVIAAESAAPAATFVHSDKCPFTLGVLESMKVEPFGGTGNSATRYRTAETPDSVRVSFSQQSASVRASYFVTCTGADPAKWLSRFGSDQDAACK